MKLLKLYRIGIFFVCLLFSTTKVSLAQQTVVENSIIKEIRVVGRTPPFKVNEIYLTDELEVWLDVMAPEVKKDFNTSEVEIECGGNGYFEDSELSEEDKVKENMILGIMRCEMIRKYWDKHGVESDHVTCKVTFDNEDTGEEPLKCEVRNKHWVAKVVSTGAGGTQTIASLEAPKNISELIEKEVKNQNDSILKEIEGLKSKDTNLLDAIDELKRDRTGRFTNASVRLECFQSFSGFSSEWEIQVCGGDIEFEFGITQRISVTPFVGGAYSLNREAKTLLAGFRTKAYVTRDRNWHVYVPVGIVMQSVRLNLNGRSDTLALSLPFGVGGCFLEDTVCVELNLGLGYIGSNGIAGIFDEKFQFTLGGGPRFQLNFLP